MSSYTFKELVSHTLNGITSQSDKILHLTVYLGFFIISFYSSKSLHICYGFLHSFQAWLGKYTILILFMGGLITFR